MKVDVALISFGDMKTRTVDVPANEWWTPGYDHEDQLELVFKYGQNDVQNQSHLKNRSVSTGDIIFLPKDGGYEAWAVAAFGFDRLNIKSMWEHIELVKRRGF